MPLTDYFSRKQLLRNGSHTTITVGSYIWQSTKVGTRAYLLHWGWCLGCWNPGLWNDVGRPTIWEWHKGGHMQQDPVWPAFHASTLEQRGKTFPVTSKFFLHGSLTSRQRWYSRSPFLYSYSPLQNINTLKALQKVVWMQQCHTNVTLMVTLSLRLPAGICALQSITFSKTAFENRRILLYNSAGND